MWFFISYFILIYEVKLVVLEIKLNLLRKGHVSNGGSQKGPQTLVQTCTVHVRIHITTLPRWTSFFSPFAFILPERMQMWTPMRQDTCFSHHLPLFSHGKTCIRLSCHGGPDLHSLHGKTLYTIVDIFKIPIKHEDLPSSKRLNVFNLHIANIKCAVCILISSSVI